MMDLINHGLAAWLRTEWAVPAIVGGMAIWCLLILLFNFARHYHGISQALKHRLAVLRPIEKNQDFDEARNQFHAAFGDIDIAMRRRDGCVPMVHAWLEFSETFFDPGAAVIKTTERPEGYFLHLGDNTRVLAWWANIFIAIGLTATFLGIIAALTVTTDGLRDAGTNAQGMSTALTTLLGLTAVKFWTSIGGVVASIVLRVCDRNWHSNSLRRLERLSHILEKGTLFIPSQQLALDQLHELKEQSTALREFSSQLAVGIADALQEKLNPVVTGLTGIQSSIEEFKKGSFDQIGKELGQAISQGAGSEMASLAAALTSMTDGIKGVNDRLEGASSQASEQIAQAARDFNQAAEQMSRAFAALNERLEVASTRVGAEIEDTTSRSVARLEGLIGGIQSAFDQMRGQIEDLGQKLTGTAGDVAERNADVLSKAADSLERATARASLGMADAIDIAVKQSAEASAEALSKAFAAFGERFESASAGLIESLRSSVGRMEALASAIERSTGAANDHAGKLADAGREARGVADMLGRAANDVSIASTPIRDAAVHIREGINQGNQVMQRLGEESARNSQTLQNAASSLERTSETAGQAWEGYSDRFGGLDEVLAKALDQIQGATREHATRLNEHVGRIDGALAQAVDRLAEAIEPLTELSSDLSDVLQQLRTK